MAQVSSFNSTERPVVVQDVSAPNLIVVFAIEALPSSSSTKAPSGLFSVLAHPFRELGSVIVDPVGLSITVALEPGADVSTSVAGLGNLVERFEQEHQAMRLRSLIHYGTAFRAVGPGGVRSFQGSALRSASNALRRSSLPAGIYATPDFSGFVSTLKGVQGFSLSSFESGEYPEVVLVGNSRGHTSELHSTDPDLVAWLTARLAKDLGPFASALIDNASHSTRTAKELAAAVGHEIVNPADRQQFDADVFKYIRSRNY